MIIKTILTKIIVFVLFFGSFNMVIAAENPNPSKLEDIPMNTGSVFEDSSIFGTVYIDANENGIQDEGEKGIEGVIIVTASGQIIITDQNGRYSLVGVSGGRSERGTNLILKLDKQSLPENYQLIGRQTEVVRLSPGIPQKVDFRVIEKK